MGVIFNGISQLGNEHLAVIRSSGVAILQGFCYCGSLCKFNPDQSFWPLYRGVTVMRGSTVYNYMKNRRCTIHVGLASLAQLYVCLNCIL